MDKGTVDDGAFREFVVPTIGMSHYSNELVVFFLPDSGSDISGCRVWCGAEMVASDQDRSPDHQVVGDSGSGPVLVFECALTTHLRCSNFI